MRALVNKQRGATLLELLLSLGLLTVLMTVNISVTQTAFGIFQRTTAGHLELQSLETALRQQRELTGETAGLKCRPGIAVRHSNILFQRCVPTSGIFKNQFSDFLLSSSHTAKKTP